MTTETISDSNIDTAANEAQVLAFERRRAGRLDVNPSLVPLLRDPANSTGARDPLPPFPDSAYRDFLEADPFHDQMAPARGILLGLSISMLFWGAVGYTIFR